MQNTKKLNRPDKFNKPLGDVQQKLGNKQNNQSKHMSNASEKA